jgi:exosortase A
MTALKDKQRKYLVASLIAIGLVVLVYFETFHTIVMVWLTSETFFHGFIIFPISLYLIWTKLPQLRLLDPMPFLPGAVALALISLFWFGCRFMGIQVGMQLAVVAMIPALLLTSLGKSIAGRIAFPLAYLVFAVPFGEVLIPFLTDYTAAFTVKALNLTGIPVVRDGKYFSIPSGDFEVARACSGIRYLLAALALGTMFSYLSYRSNRKRAIFIAFSFVLPIVANGIRAYGIVLLAHYSDMKIAVGLDHLLFGWIFFGIVIGLLFLIGNLFRDPETDEPAHGRGGNNGLANTKPDGSPLNIVAVIALSVLSGSSGAVLASLASDSDDSNMKSLAGLPSNIQGWNASAAYPIDVQPDFHGATREIFGSYERKGDNVYVAAIQYVGHQQGAELANAANTVVGGLRVGAFGNVRSLRISPNNGAPISVSEVAVTQSDGSFLVWYWFGVNGHPVSGQVGIKVREAMGLLSSAPVVSTAVILVGKSAGDEDTNRSILQEFFVAAYEQMASCLATTSSRSECGNGVSALGEY